LIKLGAGFQLGVLGALSAFALLNWRRILNSIPFYRERAEPQGISRCFRVQTQVLILNIV